MDTKPRTRLGHFGAVAAILIGLSSSAYACCMMRKGSQGVISQDSQSAVIVHQNGREDLILGINYQIVGVDAPEFAWIVTVPSEPDRYRVAPRKIFSDMGTYAAQHLRIHRDWDRPQRRPRAGAVDSEAAPKGVELGERVSVGPFDIQPVRALGMDALDGLNKWLEKNGFPTEDADHMAYFVEKNFTFLCIKVTPEAGAESVPANGALPPLHISFETEKPYYPLRFSSRQGVFDVNVHTLTREPLDYENGKDMFKRLNVHQFGYRTNFVVATESLPESMRDALEWATLDDETWYMNALYGRGVNRDDAIATWEDDIFFETVDPRRAAR